MRLQWNLPNFISLARIPLAVLFALTESVALRVVLIVTAALTDWLDGWIARRFGMGSSSGEVLDPVTDKLFVATVMGTYLLRGLLRPWELVLLWLRDLYNSFAFVLLSRRKLQVRFKSRKSGKLVTVAQMMALVLITLAPSAATYAVIATAALSVYSIVDYTRAGLVDLRHGQNPG